MEEGEEGVVSENFFNAELENAAVQSAQYYIAEDGSLKFITPYLSSPNFDGTMPIVDEATLVSQVRPGMMFSSDGSIGSDYFPIVGLSYEDEDLSGVSPTEYTVIYMDSSNQIKSQTFNSTDSVYVRYEDWDEKDVGTQGWAITSGGNAIFANVAVRGRVEATEGAIEGDLTLGGSLTASSNTGQLIISSSGIFGSTASGLFHLDNIDGEVSFTGDITANSGAVKKLTIGAGKSYPIINLVGTASVTSAGQSGNFILTLDSNSKSFYPGDYFYINGVKTSGMAFQNGSPTTASPFFNQISINRDGFWTSPYTYEILTASYSSPNDSYFCRITQGGLASNQDFSQVTGSSGSISFGYVYFGEYSSYSLFGGTFIDGLVLSTIGPGTFFENYIPDYIDLSGRFSLGKGNIVFDGNNLSVSGQITASTLDVGGVNGITYDGSIVTIGASVVINAPAVFTGDSITYEFLSASYADLADLKVSGTTIINGGNITTGTINANSASIININASNITAGTLTGRTISGGLITGTTLSGVTGNFSGTITSNSGSIGGWKIEGGRIFARDLGAGLSGVDLLGGALPKIKFGDSDNYWELALNGIETSGFNLYPGINVAKGIVRSGSVSGPSTPSYPGQGGDLNLSINGVGGLANTRIASLSIRDTPTGTFPGTLTSVPSINLNAGTSGIIINSSGAQLISGAFYGPNTIEYRQVLISTLSPSSPGSYRGGTLWARI